MEIQRSKSPGKVDFQRCETVELWLNCWPKHEQVMVSCVAFYIKKKKNMKWSTWDQRLMGFLMIHWFWQILPWDRTCYSQLSCIWLGLDWENLIGLWIWRSTPHIESTLNLHSLASIGIIMGERNPFKSLCGDHAFVTCWDLCLNSSNWWFLIIESSPESPRVLIIS